MISPVFSYIAGLGTLLAFSNYCYFFQGAARSTRPSAFTIVKPRFFAGIRESIAAFPTFRTRANYGQTIPTLVQTPSGCSAQPCFASDAPDLTVGLAPE